MRNHSATFILVFLFLAVSCGGDRKASSSLELAPLRYATNLTCERGEGYSLWTLRDPWDTTAVLHRYLLRTVLDSCSSERRDRDAEVANEIGISQAQVSRLEKSAIKHIKRMYV